MNLAIRPASLETDQQLLIDTLWRYLTPLSDSARFNWLYKDNPHGLARVWIMSDTTTGTVVGVAGAFPRRVYIGQREETCWVLGDFCMHEHYRSLGPALQLQRACLAAIHPETVAFCYDFPSPSMLAIYKRLRLEPHGNMYRFAKLLRVDRKAREAINIPLLASLVSAAGNLVLRLQDRRRRATRGIATDLHEGRCEEEFSALAYDMRDQYGVCVRRTAEYLTWRYVAHPLVRYELLTARRHGDLAAYAVFTHTGADAMLVDLFGVKDPAVMSTLVDTVIRLLRQRQVVTLSAPLWESHPWRTLLQQYGFRAREASPVVIYLSPHSSPEGSVLKGMDWFFMDGDRDS